MRGVFRAAILLGAAVVAVGITACGGDTVGGVRTPSLTIFGSAGAPPPVLASRGVSLALNTPLGVRAAADAQGGTVVGDPSAVSIGMYALYLSENADCSAPVLVVDNGATPVLKDFIQNPVLFTGSPPAGSYRCVIFRMSDVIQFESAAAAGLCATHTPYTMDIYRAPDTDWLDVNGEHITATGSDASPSDDRVYIFASTDPTALTARGVSPHQILSLTGTLTVPGSGTFYWDATGTVGYDANGCGMNPPQLAFR